MALTERFPTMTPLTIRKTRASEIFLLIRRLDNYDTRHPADGGDDDEIIRRPASDNWF